MNEICLQYVQLGVEGGEGGPSDSIDSDWCTDMTLVCTSNCSG